MDTPIVTGQLMYHLIRRYGLAYRHTAQDYAPSLDYLMDLYMAWWAEVAAGGLSTPQTRRDEAVRIAALVLSYTDAVLDMTQWPQP